MSGQTTTQQNQQTQSSTQPWSAAQPQLQSILGALGQGSVGATSGQTAATNNLVSQASGLPSYAPQAENTIGNLFNTNTNAQQGMLNNAYTQASSAYSPMLSSTYTNPMTAPGMGDALSAMNSDITQQINGQFAAAGRPAGTNADSSQALARGLSQGEGQLLTNEYNTLSGNQLNAASGLESAAGNTASGLTNQQEVPLTNALQGISATSALPGVATQPAATQLAAQTTAAQLPYANAATIEGLTNPIAALGSQSSGTTSGTTTQQSPMLTNILGAGAGGLGLLGAMGGFGSTGFLTGSNGLLGQVAGLNGTGGYPSDRRAKKDIEQVGTLFDGTPVYRFRYSIPGYEMLPTQIGLMAQDVEQFAPDAVMESNGLKMVDYRAATERARSMMEVT